MIVLVAVLCRTPHTHRTIQSKTTKNFITHQISKTNWGKDRELTCSEKEKERRKKRYLRQNSNIYRNLKSILLTDLHESVRGSLGAPLHGLVS